MPTLDPALREALERQLALLLPGSRALAAAAAHPPHLASHDWRGTAAGAYREREQELARLLNVADRALADTVSALRRAEAVGGG